jgi:hypothetical protein
MFPLRSQAILKIRNRADLANSMFVDDAELVDLLNDNIEIAYHHCVAAYGDTTFANDTVLSGIAYNQPSPSTTWPTGYVNNGSGVEALRTRFTLPPDFGRLLRCEWVLGKITLHTLDSGQPNIEWIPMHPLDMQGMVFDSTPQDWRLGQVGYWISSHPSTPQGETDDASFRFSISFLPVPKSVVSIHFIYVPDAPAYGTDDTGVIKLPDLAWRFVREATSADLLEKQRSDSSALRANAAMYLADIDNSKLHPDFANPARTVDIYGGSSISPYGHRRQVW